MYTIAAHADGSYTVRLPNAVALAHLLGRHNATPQTEYINNAEAHQIAIEQDIHLPRTTLISACKRGTIPGAQKQGGRWRMPRQAFMAWLTKGEPEDEEASLWGEKTH